LSPLVLGVLATSGAGPAVLYTSIAPKPADPGCEECRMPRGVGDCAACGKAFADAIRDLTGETTVRR
jgi:hypothetical protein